MLFPYLFLLYKISGKLKLIIFGLPEKTALTKNKMAYSKGRDYIKIFHERKHILKTTNCSIFYKFYKLWITKVATEIEKLAASTGKVFCNKNNINFYQTIFL